MMRSLGDKIEHLQTAPLDSLSRGEQLVLGGLEDRIAKLVEKLDASEGSSAISGRSARHGRTLVHLEACAPTASARAPATAMPGCRRTARQPCRSGAQQGCRRAQARADHRRATRGLARGRAWHDPDRGRSHRRHRDRLEGRRGARPMGTLLGPSTDGRAFAQAAASSSAAARAAIPARAPPAPRAAPPARPAAATARQISLPHDHPLEPGSGPPRVRPSYRRGQRPTALPPPGVARGAAIAAGAAGAADSKSNYLRAARRAVCGAEMRNAAGRRRRPTIRPARRQARQPAQGDLRRHQRRGADRGRAALRGDLFQAASLPHGGRARRAAGPNSTCARPRPPWWRARPLTRRVR